MLQSDKKKLFKKILLKWNREKNTRHMPWKGEKDPYKIWLSEIILQQTRVEQGMEYYNLFVKKFPDIHKLANAPDTLVMKMWEGLGYYSRCRNLHTTAKLISKELKGVFPKTHEQIKMLRGVGPYTAAAISSFAYNLPHAVVDGNVFRVLSRVFGIKKPVDSTEGKKYFTRLAGELLDKKQPGVYNQAIMDFGAVICKPVSPHCNSCVLKKNCFALQHDCIPDLPVKEKNVSVKSRWFYYIVPVYKNEIFITQRTGKDIWNQLYEFVLIEQKNKLSKQGLSHLMTRFENGVPAFRISTLFTQLLSHQKINAWFIQLSLRQKSKFPIPGIWINKSQLSQYAFPGVIREYLQSIR